MTRIVLLIPCFNGREYLGDCLRSLLESGDADLQTSIVVTDNASTDGSADLVAREFPTVDLVRLADNRGFAGGVNAGWKYAREKFPDVKYVGIVNQDAIASPRWLTPLVSHLHANPQTAAVQPKVMLGDRRDCFNTAGNRSHYLGFGLVTAYGHVDDGSRDQICEIDFPSGAAALIRAEAFATGDIFDDLYFLYLEDAELGWKLRQLGHRIEFIPASVVWHHYSYRHDYKFYFYLERNRWYLLATYYKLPTLVLLSPAIVAMEFGQLYFAWRNGVLGQKWAAMTFFLAPKNLKRLLDTRRKAQRRRRIGDRQFVHSFVGEIDLPELRSKTLRRIGNPILRAYWHIVRPLIVW
jgi:GT2 family glycosyltransferase